MVSVKRTNTKYVARINSPTGNKNSKYRYFYSKDAYNAYLNNLRKSKVSEQNVNASKTNNTNVFQPKYVKRIETNNQSGNKYRYFYSEKEVNAYLNKQKNVKVSSLDKTVADKGKNLVSSILSNLRKIPGNVKKTTDKAKESIKTTAKKVVDKTTDVAINIANKAPAKIDKVVNKTKEVANKIYDDKNNIYDVNQYNYDKKIEKVKATQEWKDIVARKDPEYVKKNKDGSTSYLIDDYLAKKKKPLLDIADDIVMGRNVSTNKIEKDAIVAGIKEDMFSAVTFGMMVAGVATKLYIEKTKLHQGSYKEEVDAVKNNIESGAKFVGKISTSQNPISDAEAERMVEMIQNSKTAKETVTSAKNSINEDNVVKAAQILMASDNIPSSVKTNEYYQSANRILSNLSEEEIVLLNILLNNIRKSNA